LTLEENFNNIKYLFLNFVKKVVKKLKSSTSLDILEDLQETRRTVYLDFFKMPIESKDVILACLLKR